jgi:hypothetical protein
MSPMPHPRLPQYYLVALEQCFANQRIVPSYRLYLFDNLVRIYTSDTLPPIIKTHLSIIRVSPQSDTYISDDKLHEVDMYINFKDTELSHIGWRASENIFVIVLDEKEIHNLIRSSGHND